MSYLLVECLGKKKLNSMEKQDLKEKKQGKIFNVSLDVEKHNILIVGVSKGYDLRIDGISFQILQKQEIFSTSSQENDTKTMSNQLLPDKQED